MLNWINMPTQTHKVCPIKRHILKNIKPGEQMICRFVRNCHRKDKANCEFQAGGNGKV